MRIKVTVNGRGVYEQELNPGDACGFELLGDQATFNKFNVEALAMFEAFRKAYPGKKRGLATEFKNFQDKHKKDWKIELPKLLNAVETQIREKKIEFARSGWTAQWPMMSVWINNRRWELESQPMKPPNFNKNVNLKEL